VLKLFNTLSQQKETFNSIYPQKVKMYCCGITPYSHIHLGHMRTFFSYDLLYRTLIDQGYDIEWARNITDVDDKIIIKANNENKTCDEITEQYISDQTQHLKTFSLHSPMFEPRVTENIPQIIEMIQKLIDKDFAYVSLSGVYFRVRHFSQYGKLSKNKIDELKQGARIEVDESKEDPLDFALWKFAKQDEISWQTPWGDGRPGWHIECSAMINSLFGESIDIHMGGRDLIFPHHEAEIAQSEACTGTALANYWLHCGMMTLYHEKMSKSTNHFVSVEDFLSQYPPEVLRLVFLSVSYSQPLDFTFELAAENLKKLSKIYRFVSLIDVYSKDAKIILEKKETPLQESEDLLSSLTETQDVFLKLPLLKQKMREHLEQDLNSAMALAEFFEFIKEVNSKIIQLEKSGKDLTISDLKILSQYWEDFKGWMSASLALLTQIPSKFFEYLRSFNCEHEISEVEILKKITLRSEYRDQKEWQKSDAIRDELLKYGVHVMDTPRGTKWFLT